MVQVFQEMPEQPHPLGQALGQGLGQLAQKIQQQQKQEEQGGILSKILDPNTPPEERQRLSQGLDPQTQLKLFEVQQKQEVANQKALFQQAKFKQSQEPKRAPEDIERAKIKVRAQEKGRTKSEEAIPELQDQISTLQYLRTLSKDLRGPGGVAKALVGSSTATEFNSLGFTSIAPIIKLFNPVGPIPVAKIKIIEKRFAPQAGELYSTQQGKLNALDRMANQALKRNQKYLELLEAYDNNIPQEEMNKFSSESAKELDEIVEEESKLLGITEKEPEKEEKKEEKQKIIKMKAPDGRTLDVPKEEVERMKSLGAKEL